MHLFSRTKILTLILLVAVVATPVGISISNGIHVQRAQAQMDAGELGKGFVVGVAACFGVAYAMKYISAGVALVPAGPVPDASSETPVRKALDCILYQVVNTIIEDMIKSITVWAQSGFEGNPVFTTQVQQQMLNVLDNVAGMYIDSKAPLLCSPFRAEIQLALMQSYQRSSGRFLNSCSLSEVIGNVDQFIAGDFYSGGFDGWIEMVSTPYGNPYGAFLETQMGLQMKLLNAEGRQSKDLLQGQGFMSKQVQDCYLWPPDGTGPPQPYDENETGPPQGTVTCDEPRTVTPGSFIQEQVGKQLGMSAERLSFADEINEMITAVIAYLIRDMLTDDEGLAGYDPADYAGNEYPELPEVDEFPVDPPGGGGQCTPMEITAGKPGELRVIRDIPDHIASDEHPRMEFQIRDENGDKKNYSRVRIEFDLTVGSFDTRPQSDQLNIFWFHRGPGLNNFIWGANDIVEVVHNNGNSRMRLATSVNVCAPRNKSTRSPFREGGEYHVLIDYNPGERTMSVNVTGGQNGSVSQLTTVTTLQNEDQRGRNGFFFAVGGDYIPGGNEGMTGNGWKWENIEVEFFPGPETSGLQHNEP